jgi:hypothetical protein
MISFLVLWGLLSCGVASLSICCEYNRAQHIKSQELVALEKKKELC